MDDISKLFDNTAIEDESPNHPHFSNFKNEGKVAERQRSRRKEHLERQKCSGEDKLDKFRNLTVENQNAFRRKTIHKSQFGDKLMLSDWLVDIPDTLSTEWTMVPCPTGRRCLVVTSGGLTVAFTKKGNPIERFRSKLPGGDSACNVNTTMLDCIFVRDKKEFYVLDLICWNSQYYVDNDFACRQYVLKSKLSEELDQLSASHTFISLPSCECSTDKMKEFMKTPFGFELDGLLFYYSEAHYIPEQTPLVGWLKPWMLPEILYVEVPEEYCNGVEYESSLQFIEEYNNKHKHISSLEKKEKENEGIMKTKDEMDSETISQG